MHINRRNSLLGTAAAGVALAGTRLVQAAVRPLPLLPLTDLTGGIDRRIALALTAAVHDFGNGGASATYGINNDYLGPVLRVKQGQTLPFDVTNGTEDISTLHWHGLHIPGGVDGGPHQQILPGDTWSPDVAIVQHASMNWFHAHTHGKTAEQTYKGLAGVMLIEDDASLAADLPHSYGVDDFTLVLQDKMFNSAGEMSYELTGEVFEQGFHGNTLVVNGAIAPVTQTVPTGLVRLRLLNACNARFLTLSMSTGPVTVIASDGGFLGLAVETETLFMSPGERYEILIDMNTLESNSLMVAPFDDDEGLSGFLEDLFGSMGTEMVALTLTRSGDQGFTGSMPNLLANLSVPKRAEASVLRSFSLNMGGGDGNGDGNTNGNVEDFAALARAWGNFCGDGVMGINGLPMNLDRIDEHVRKGDTEIWRISGGETLHPFHVHGCSFRILSQQNGTPPAYAQGWKDMVHVENGWSEVLVKFKHKATDSAPYMYHCHILEHEDCGMMGQFTVT